MSRRCLWSSIINNTITEAIDYFWRDGHHSDIRTGKEAGKEKKMSRHLSVVLKQKTLTMIVDLNAQTNLFF